MSALPDPPMAPADLEDYLLASGDEDEGSLLATYRAFVLERGLRSEFLAYLATRWADAEEARPDTCRDCGADLALDAGEGWNGRCGTCADKTEAREEAP